MANEAADFIGNTIGLETSVKHTRIQQNHYYDFHILF